MPSAIRISSGGGFVEVNKPRVKSGGMLAQFEEKCARLEDQVESLEKEIVEKNRDNISKDEKLSIMKSLLEDNRVALESEEKKNKELSSDIDLLRFIIDEKRVSRLSSNPEGIAVGLTWHRTR